MYQSNRIAIEAKRPQAAAALRLRGDAELHGELQQRREHSLAPPRLQADARAVVCSCRAALQLGVHI